MKSFRKKDVLRILYPPKIGDRVRIKRVRDHLNELSGILFRGQQGTVLCTWIDDVTRSQLVEVKLDDGTVEIFFEDIIEVLYGS